jgi:uncharacterized protein (TIGR02001 family)
MQKQIKKSLILGVGLFSLAGITQATELTANAGITSNYVFRGITQTDDGIALQGGVDYVHDAGFYAGAWASNVEFGNDKGYETDLYAGYNFKLNESVTFDVGYIAYLYHSLDSDADASEIYFGASFKDVSVTYYNGDRDAGPDYAYIDLKYTMALPSDFNLHLHYGHQDDDATASDYDDASLGVSKNIEGFDVGLTVTTIDGDANVPDDNEVFLTVNKAFNLM